MNNATQNESQYLTMSELIGLQVMAALANDGFIDREYVLFETQGVVKCIASALDHAVQHPIIQSDMAHAIGATLSDEPRRLSISEMCLFVDTYRAGLANDDGLSVQESVVLAAFREMQPDSQGRVLALLDTDQDGRAALIAQLTPDQRGQLETLIKAFTTDQDAG